MRRTENRLGRKWLRRLLALAVMVAAVAGLLSQTVFAMNSYIITDGDTVTVHKSHSTDPVAVLDEVGMQLGDEDTYTTTYNDGVNRITIQRMQMVTVIRRGVKSTVGTYGETVEQLLSRMGLRLEEGDSLSCDASTPTFDGMTVEITNRRVETLTDHEVVPFKTKYFEDPTLKPNEIKILVKGSDGMIRRDTEVVYTNGVETSRRLVLEETEVEMVTQLVLCGYERHEIMEQPDAPDHQMYHTYIYGQNEPDEKETHVATDIIGDGVITTVSGNTYTYTKVLNVLATAYACDGYTGRTATGSIARVGAIAVDPKVIPLGTKMYIVSDDGQYVYGYCTAEDTGGLIIGYRVDLYFDTIADCYEFGARNCKVYILE